MPNISKKLSSFSKQEVAQLFSKAKRVLKKHPGLDILCAPTAQDFGRILIITSRKVGKASKRNLIRRRLKAIFYEEKLYEKGLDCIVIVKKEGINLPFKELKGILRYVVKKTP